MPIGNVTYVTELMNVCIMLKSVIINISKLYKNYTIFHVLFIVPGEFQIDPYTKTLGDPSRRPEIQNATIEYIASQDYMVSECT